MAIPFSQFRPITSTTAPFSSFLLLIKLFLLISVCASLFIVNCHGFSIKEAIIEVNPDVLSQADKADLERKMPRPNKLNTTAGSFSLLNSVVPRDAWVVRKLRKAGALIMGKASLSEWSHFRGTTVPSAWCGRSKQGVNPYVILSKGPFSRGACGSSSGSAISVAANLVTVSLGTETDGLILCPASSNAVIAIKPTVGLTSRAGVFLSRLDRIRCCVVLNSIVGFDPNDAVATSTGAKFIPKDGYSQFLKKDGLRGKRLGIVRILFGGPLLQLFEGHIETLRYPTLMTSFFQGAVIVDNIEIDNIQTIYDPSSGEMPEMLSEFKQSLNVYLKDLVTSPVRSLADVIAFNKNNLSLEMTDVYDQYTMIDAEKTSGNEAERQGALLNMQKLDNEGFKSMIKNNLDAVVTPGNSFSTVLAIGGHPGIIVPAGYEDDGMPVGICFEGLRGSEPKLIEISYGFEQITLIRKPPPSTTFISDV
ncbi:hypothetical protein MKX03_024092 [Papaver bracteatum]|nr:hypothetical protein MKX03_024092 [Papaver bracteatum]